MGRVFSGRDISNWKVVTATGEVMNYPAGHNKAGKPMKDLDGFKSANKLARQCGGFAVRV